MLMLPLAVALMGAAGQPVTPPTPTAQPAIPAIAHQLPATWPPPGWPTRVTLPGEQPVKVEPAATAIEKDVWVTVFPNVRLNRALKAVEFDGVVAWDFHNADTPRTELELLVCLPMRDKEHESLVLSKAKGADVHAALLMTGLEPGTPGKIEFGAGEKKDEKQPGVKRVAPVGPEVTVQFVYAKDGKDVVADPRAWVVDESADGEPKTKDASKESTAAPTVKPFTYIFGGSKVGQMRNPEGQKVNVYSADELGTLIGLCTFGSETVGITRVYSPDSGVDAPNFVARNEAIPGADTPVRVRIGAARSNKAADAPAEKATSVPR